MKCIGILCLLFSCVSCCLMPNQPSYEGLARTGAHMNYVSTYDALQNAIRNRFDGEDSKKFTEAVTSMTNNLDFVLLDERPGFQNGFVDGYVFYKLTGLEVLHAMLIEEDLPYKDAYVAGWFLGQMQSKVQRMQTEILGRE